MVAWAHGTGRGRQLVHLVEDSCSDAFILRRVTGTAADRLCRAGDTVGYHEYAVTAHNVVPAAAHDLNAWLAARFGTRSPAPVEMPARGRLTGTDWRLGAAENAEGRLIGSSVPSGPPHWTPGPFVL